MKTREEYWYDEPLPLTTGSASVVAADTNEPSDASKFAGVLLVPDIERRRGWREYYVERVQPKPGARQIGFHP